MAVKKYTCPPQSASGAGTFSDNLVGLQLVDGGGFTQGNFEFTSVITEKQNRTFSIGSFSDPINLDSIGIETIAETKTIIEKNFTVYPNYDLSQVTNFTLYGSLVKRFSVSVSKIINYFPGGLEVFETIPSYSTQQTAQNIVYDSVEDETSFDIPLSSIRNPFGIDFTTNANVNFQTLESQVSPLRNLTTQFQKYSLFVGENNYPLTFIIPTDSTSQVLSIVVQGRPFSADGITYETLLVRPNDFYVNKTFNEDFDGVENFLLNRQISPIYTAIFQVPRETDSGTYYVARESISFPLETEFWNLDIRTVRFTNYLEQINTIAESLDTYQTNLISRFLTTGAIKEFDTADQKMEKVLQIYGRSFDQTKQFIDALSTINSVRYNVKNDIPSQLLKNLAQTLGWNTNISPISNEELLNSVFSTSDSDFTGVSKGMTPEELNYQYYRNLILNSAYLFKSKGTRKSIEILLRLIGAPEALVEFNEYVYLADQKININQFETQFAQISGGTYTQELPVLDTNDIFSIMGVQYTGFTTQTIVQDVPTTIDDYPIDENGYPAMIEPSETYYFQIGGGWFESTPQHRMPEQVDLTNSVFTGSNPTYQTVLQPFNYGEQYLQRYKNFPYMDIGFRLRRVADNKKSWIDTENPNRESSDGNFNSNYTVGDDRLVINVKNVDIFMNPAQGLVYDVWNMSKLYNYPIPEQGLNYIPPTFCDPNPKSIYPQRGGVDWTEIVPKPKQKTFFEFAQTFWQNMINVRNRQFITDGKTGGYPTLQSIYWRYLESEQAINIPNDNFTYQTMIDYVNGLGDYWVRLIEQMIPATTIWNTGVKYENSIFHRQKFVWRRQRGCQIIPVPCKPCYLVGQIFAYDCPIQSIECNLKGFNGSPTTQSFNTVLVSTINDYLTQKNIQITDCLVNSIQSNWYVNVKFNDDVIINYLYFQGFGLNNNNFSAPTVDQWIQGVTEAFSDLQNYGLSYILDDNGVITVYNINCIPLNVLQTFEINSSINFNILCNQ
jgi:hypothetical protein